MWTHRFVYMIINFQLPLKFYQVTVNTTAQVHQIKIRQTPPRWLWNTIRNTKHDTIPDIVQNIVHDTICNTSAKPKSPSLNLFSLLYPQTQKKWNWGFPEIWHCFTVPQCSLSRRNDVFKRLDQCTHTCECDNEPLMNGSHFLWQYHKSSLAILLCRAIRLVLAMMIVLAPDVWWSV